MRLKTPLLKDQIDERIAAHFKQAGHRVNVEVQRLGEPAEPGTEKGGSGSSAPGWSPRRAATSGRAPR